MSFSCRRCDNEMTDYLDGLMDNRSRQRFEAHLLTCEACRTGLELQKEWLVRRDSILLDNAKNGSVPTDLNLKVMAAVRMAAAKPESIVERPKKPLYMKFAKWPAMAGAAAAVLVLVALWQGLPSMELAMSGRTKQANGTVVQYSTTSDFTSPAALDHLSGWLIFSVQDGKAVSGEESSDVRQEMHSLASEGDSCIANVMNLADNIHVAIRKYVPELTLILVPEATDNPELMKSRIKDALATCENPIQIEIIRSDDLEHRLDTLDQSLHGVLFPRLSNEPNWILVLIGE